jgi:hypothetical protein
MKRLFLILFLLITGITPSAFAETATLNQNNPENYNYNGNVRSEANVPVTSENRQTSAETENISSAPIADNDLKNQPNVLVNKRYDNHAFVQVGFAPDIPDATRYSKVTGLKFGLPMSAGEGKVKGLEFSILASGTHHISGMQIGILLNYSWYIDGFQLAAINLSEVVLNGFQLSAVNVCRESANGVQMGAGNVVEGTVEGFQLGAVNYAGSAEALQIGAVNISNKGGFQIGLINYITDGIVPVLPLFNFSLK